jgi:hypothetical protein
VQEPVRGSLGESGILDVFAEHTCALLFAASEEASAIMLMRLRTVLLVVQIVEHRFLLYRIKKEKKLIREADLRQQRASQR